MMQLRIDSDISKAATLPAAFYRSAEVFEQVKEKILAESWHYAADCEVVALPGQVFPFSLLEGVLNEPLAFTQNTDGRVFCLSNVCTHRGKVVIEKAGTARMLSCGYHGRCFRLDGSFKSMPGFEGAQDFPTKADDLPQVPFAQWLGQLYVSLNPKISFEEMTQPMRERLRWLPLDELVFDPTQSQDYYLDANWALYCDNYLEGFHIPFVHPALNEAIDFNQYEYELFPYCNLQLGIAKDGEPCFDIPAGEQDHGRQVYGYYFWMFPNLMFNFYPWGLSLNVVEPLSHQKTRIRFRSYCFKNTPFSRSVNNLDITEMEDEEVVLSVQRGIQSRFYKEGRFSPSMEPCVHHFHSLLARFLASE